MADRKIGSALVDPYAVPTKKDLKSAFDAYKDYRSPEIEEKCAPEISSD
jgi:hypothetical protein